MSVINNSGVVRIRRQGAPSVFEYTLETIGNPKANEVLISQKAIALNFVDVLFRNGSFPLNDLPATLGVEGAGVVEAVGSGVKQFTVGDRVAYYFSLGAYAQRRLIREEELVKLPDEVSFDEASALLAKGLTARMLVKQAYPVQPGDVILVHAAAGGVGSLVSRWAKALGATVIGTVGRAAKKALASSQSLDHVIALDTDDLGSQVRSVTNNQGVQAVFDGVGRATFGSSLDLMKPGGSMVLFGTASGEPAIDATYLASQKIKLLRPSLGQYLPDKMAVDTATYDLFNALRQGLFGPINPTSYPLTQVASAHQDLEAGLTTGSVIFHP